MYDVLQLLRLKVKGGLFFCCSSHDKTRDGPKINQPRPEIVHRGTLTFLLLLIQNSWSSHTATCNSANPPKKQTHTHTDSLSYTVQLALLRGKNIFTFTSLEKKKKFFFFFVCNIKKCEKWVKIHKAGLEEF